MMFEDAFGLHEEATIRATVNKSLEKGLCAGPMRTAQPIKQVMLEIG
jgi:hypothetical protein